MALANEVLEAIDLKGQSEEKHPGVAVQLLSEAYCVLLLLGQGTRQGALDTR
eukprot:CAMPEP_0118993088 /NCGR_PEP_ID=MMETSP1173-20130426/54423_1 /TAXON_ID=1034831 /ORGANISM="Rhizochromulina marina cf, Strain CCMP1243" /LENGTH=51 /DNA_ID=CAMNT_0006944315 /DNA_START=135 /DNA_END=286 /DNA_ORIENTATION=-